MTLCYYAVAFAEIRTEQKLVSLDPSLRVLRVRTRMYLGTIVRVRTENEERHFGQRGCGL